jgi:alpha-tubulin suppressor-like RCC1 family protein
MRLLVILVLTSACTDKLAIAELPPDVPPMADAGGDSTVAPDGGSASDGCVVRCDSPRQACVVDRCVPLFERAPFVVGHEVTCAHTAEGELWCWGHNRWGQITGVDNQRTVAPRSMRAETSWVQLGTELGIAVCGLAPDRAMWCWGSNYAGALGLGDVMPRSSPVRVPSSTLWSRVRSGSGHSCAIDAQSRVWCSGRNEDGELGQGDREQRTAFTLVDLPKVSFLSVGWGHTCALQSDASLWCWGRNVEGQLGVGDTEPRLVPTRVGSNQDWRYLSASGTHTCAIRKNGALWCWGKNDEGQLGVGDRAIRAEPSLVSNGPFRQVSSGLGHSCGVTADGALFCWGAQLGVKESVQTTPQRVGSESDWEAVFIGYSHACASRTDRTLWCWGDNADGQLGNLELPEQSAPVRVAVPAL